MKHKDPYSFTAAHLNALKVRAAAVASKEDADALAAALVEEGRTGHVSRAAYNPTLRRIEIALHPGASDLSLALAIGTE